ncbi:MAG: hypothetical protein ACYC7L_13920 [Nitrospirota bacterium]
MGITIHASGKISDTNHIEALIADVKEIAARHGWRHHVISDDFETEPNATLTPPGPGTSGAVIEGSLGLKGIVLNIGDGAESFSILFDRSGVLTDLLNQLMWIENKGAGERLTSCKTQFADIESHIRLIEVLDLLKGKYIPDLTVDDEGSYWEHRDRRALAEKRILLGQYMRCTEKILKGIELSEADRQNAETIAERIEEALRKNVEEDNNPDHQQ